MNHHDEKPHLTRREAVAAGLAGAAAIATTSATQPAPKARREKGRMPAVFVPHGGGPWPFVDVGIGDKAELQALADYLRSLRDLPTVKPTAVLVVSAHWEAPVPTVMV